MVEVAVFRTSPLKAHHRRLEQASSQAVRLAELPFRAQINLRGDPEDEAFHDAVRSVLGVAPPLGFNTVARTEVLDVLWPGPDEWLVVAKTDSQDRLVPALRGALDGRHAEVVDVSANRTILELSGPKAREVLMKGCTLDFHPRAFRPGSCAQSILARVPVILDLRDETPTFRIFVSNSFAIHLATWLMDAVAEYRD